MLCWTFFPFFSHSANYLNSRLQDTVCFSDLKAVSVENYLLKSGIAGDAIREWHKSKISGVNFTSGRNEGPRFLDLRDWIDTTTSSVYLAFDVNTNREVAVKIFPSSKNIHHYVWDISTVEGPSPKVVSICNPERSKEFNDSYKVIKGQSALATLGDEAASQAFKRALADIKFGQKRLEQESSIGKKLPDNFNTKYLDSGEIGGVRFLVTEYIPGKRFYEYFLAAMQSSEIDGPKLKKVFQIAKDILDELEKLHSNDIVHLDLQSGNIIIGNDGKIYIIDLSGAAASYKSTRLVPVQATLPNSSPKLIEAFYKSLAAHSSGDGGAQYAGDFFGPSDDLYSVWAMLVDLLTIVRDSPFEGATTWSRGNHQINSGKRVITQYYGLKEISRVNRLGEVKRKLQEFLEGPMLEGDKSQMLQSTHAMKRVFDEIIGLLD